MNTRNFLILLWKWQPLIASGEKYDIINIENSRQHKIIRLNEKLVSALDIFSELTEKLKLTKDDNIILLRHIGAPLKKNLNNNDVKILNYLPTSFKVKIHDFGGGNSFIYWHTEFKTGLLGQDIDFMLGKNYEYVVNKKTGEEEMVFSSVVQWNEKKTEYKIKEKYFNEVWWYYKYQVKKQVFELYEHLIIYLIAKRQKQELFGEKLPLFLLKEDDVVGKKLIQELNSLKEEHVWSTRFNEFYKHNEKQLLEKHHDLLKYIEQTSLNSKDSNGNDYLIQLRHHFANLLNLMPEQIYD